MKPFENVVGKGENAGNAGNQHSRFPTMFSTHPKINFNFSVTFILSSANAFNLDQLKYLSFGKVLKNKQTTNYNSRMMDFIFDKTILKQ